MNGLIAYCGITCSECEAYIATQENDDEKRKKVAETWSRQYKSNISQEDINCDGCSSGSTKLFSHCLVCPIRACAIEKNLENCAPCDEYACEKLREFFTFVPEAEKTLGRMRAD